MNTDQTLPRTHQAALQVLESPFRTGNSSCCQMRRRQIKTFKGKGEGVAARRRAAVHADGISELPSPHGCRSGLLRQSRWLWFALEVLREQASRGGLEELAHPSLAMLALISSFGSDQRGCWMAPALYQFQHPLQGNTSHVPSMSLSLIQGKPWNLTAAEGSCSR